jgi:hypothetical protein
MVAIGGVIRPVGRLAFVVFVVPAGPIVEGKEGFAIGPLRLPIGSVDTFPDIFAGVGIVGI